MGQLDSQIGNAGLAQSSHHAEMAAPWNQGDIPYTKKDMWRDMPGEVAGRTGEWLSDPINAGLAAQLGVAGVRGLTQLLTPDEKVNARTYRPEEIDLSRERASLRRQRDTSAASLRNMSPGSRAAQIASMTALDESLGDSLASSYQRQEVANIAGRNRAQEMNIQSLERADEKQAMLDASEAKYRDDFLVGLGNIGLGYGRDVQSQRNEEVRLRNMAESGNYTLSPDEYLIRYNEKKNNKTKNKQQ